MLALLQVGREAPRRHWRARLCREPWQGTQGHWASLSLLTYRGEGILACNRWVGPFTKAGLGGWSAAPGWMELLGPLVRVGGRHLISLRPTQRAGQACARQ